MHRCSIWQHLTINEGSLPDYHALKHFHYRNGPPGGVTRVFTARYTGPGLGGSLTKTGMIAATLVETLPPLGCTLRELALNHRYTGSNRKLAAAKLNQEVRTIARVVVHPIFRSTGLAVELVKHLLDHATTPYVEALAAMGRVHPFFQRAGMTPFDRPPHPNAIRLLAALNHQNLQPLDLLNPARIPQTPFLLNELQRFCRKKGTFLDHLHEARTRLLSQPLYYIWQRNQNP